MWKVCETWAGGWCGNQYWSSKLSSCDLPHNIIRWSSHDISITRWVATNMGQACFSPSTRGRGRRQKAQWVEAFFLHETSQDLECCLRLRLRLRLNFQKGHFQLCTALTTLKSVSEYWVTMSLIDKLSSPGQLKNLYLCHSLLRISVFDNHLALFSVMHKFFC